MGRRLHLRGEVVIDGRDDGLDELEEDEEVLVDRRRGAGLAPGAALDEVGDDDVHHRRVLARVHRGVLDAEVRVRVYGHGPLGVVGLDVLEGLRLRERQAGLVVPER